MLRTPSVLAGKNATKVNRPLACGMFLFYPARSLMVGPYANMSKLSYTTILFPWLWISSAIAPGVLRSALRLIAEKKGFDALITTQKKTLLDGLFWKKMKLDRQRGPKKVYSFNFIFSVFFLLLKFFFLQMRTSSRASFLCIALSGSHNQVNTS